MTTAQHLANYNAKRTAISNHMNKTMTERLIFGRSTRNDPNYDKPIESLNHVYPDKEWAAIYNL